MLYKLENENNNKKIIGKAMTLWGVVSAMPIVSIFSITAFVWGQMIFLAVLIISMLYSKKIIINNTIEKSYISYSVVAIMSTIVSFLVMPDGWTKGWIQGFIQLLIISIFYFYFCDSRKNFYLKKFVDGVYYSSLIQLFWGMAQYLLYKKNIDLNKIVFSDILNTMKEASSQITDQGIKISGFCWNAGNFAPLVLFGLAYSKNIFIKCLFVLIAVLSQSRTLLVGIIVYLVIYLLDILKNRKKISKSTFLCLSSLIIVGIGAAPFIFDAMTLITGTVNKAINSMFDFETNASNLTHLYYYTHVIDATKENNLFNNLFGFGLGCSGYAYPNSAQAIYLGSNVKWTIESDYINCLWSFGYIGFTFYYFWFVNNIRKIKNDKCTAFLIALLVEGITYNVSWDWMKLLIISIFILYRNGIDCFDCEESDNL